MIEKTNFSYFFLPQIHTIFFLSTFTIKTIVVLELLEEEQNNKREFLLLLFDDRVYRVCWFIIDYYGWSGQSS